MDWMDIAKGYVGITEIKGSKHNPRIVEMFKLAGFGGIKDDETAWCAAFVGACLVQAGLDTSESLAARSYEKWGLALKEPVYGCIGVKKRAGSSWMGHVGFVVGASKTQIFLLGGNQANGVNIAAFKRSEFTGYRWPIGIDIPVMPLPTTIAGAKSNVSQA